MLIAPLNVGLQPTLATQDVRARLRRARLLLERPLPVVELSSRLRPGAFEVIADGSSDDRARLRALDHVADTVGCKLTPACLSSCGLARYCRARHIELGSPLIGGEQLARLLPGVPSLGRAAALAEGARPTIVEAPIARQLVRAQRLHEASRSPGQAVAVRTS
jgi:hypothetical protein